MSGCKTNPCWPCPPLPCSSGGKDGKSAFDIWRENQPAGSDISLAAYLKSMRGIASITATTEPVTV